MFKGVMNGAIKFTSRQDPRYFRQYRTGSSGLAIIASSRGINTARHRKLTNALPSLVYFRAIASPPLISCTRVCAFQQGHPAFSCFRVESWSMTVTVALIDTLGRVFRIRRSQVDWTDQRAVDQDGLQGSKTKLPNARILATPLGQLRR
jgi:hypothetical protein